MEQPTEDTTALPESLVRIVDEDDLILEGPGQKVVVDIVSLPFLSGATIDFRDEPIGARFVIENPNASVRAVAAHRLRCEQ